MTTFGEIIADLGFKSEQQQIALLNSLRIPGYLSQRELWQAIHLIDKFDNWEEAFHRINDLFRKYGVYKDPFNPAGLLTEEIRIDREDLQDLLTFFRQSAFNRNNNQERNELAHKPWMEEYGEDFLRLSQVLGVVEEIKPTKSKYDEIWVQGASRLRTSTRLDTLKKLQSNGIESGVVRLLTGVRELWAEIDGLGEGEQKIVEGKQYMLDLAKKLGIKIVEEKPFIQRQGRTCLNYDPQEDRRVNESDMAIDIASQKNIRFELIDSKAEEARTRATTATTSLLAASELKSRNLVNPAILMISDQPFIERQRLASQASIVQYGIVDATIEGAGNGAYIENPAIGDRKAYVGIINSELGALAMEQYNQLVQGQSRKRTPTTLSYQARAELLKTTAVPDLEKYLGTKSKEEKPSTILNPTDQAQASTNVGKSVN